RLSAAHALAPDAHRRFPRGGGPASPVHARDPAGPESILLPVPRAGAAGGGAASRLARRAAEGRRRWPRDRAGTVGAKPAGAAAAGAGRWAAHAARLRPAAPGADRPNPRLDRPRRHLAREPRPAQALGLDPPGPA